MSYVNKILKKENAKENSSTKSEGRKGGLTAKLLKKQNKQLWHNSRVKRENKTEFPVTEEEGLLKVSGALAENYKKALSQIGYSTELNAFSIDKTGFSPELAQELGQHYLDTYIIIVAPEQELLPTTNPNAVTEELADQIFQTTPSLLEEITLREGLFGKIETNLAKILLTEGSPKLSAQISLDTPTQSVKRIKELKKKIIKISQKELLNDDYVSDIAKESGKLLKIHPNLEGIEINDDFPIKGIFDNFKFSTEEVDVYCLKGKGKFLFVYFSKNGQRINNHLLIDGSKLNELLNALHTYGYVEFNRNIVRNKLLELAGENVGDLQDAENLIECLGAEKSGELPKMFYECKKVFDELRGKDENELKDYFENNLPAELKIVLVQPTTNEKMVYEILSKACPEKVAMAYTHNPQLFKDVFSKATDKEKEAMLEKLIGEVKFEDQLNPEVNAWFKNNYSEICTKKGITFF